MNVLNRPRILQSTYTLMARCMSSNFGVSPLTSTKTDTLKKVVADAETVVGYPTSFLSLRWLLNDEAANIALHIKKLIGTGHPLLNTAKSLMTDHTNSTWGLVVLLVSKAAGVNSVFTEIEHDRIVGILHSQRVLAEVTEMVHISNILHKGLVNIDSDTKDKSDMNFGNSVALLSGDHLLSASFRELACLKNHDLNELISSSLRDLTEAEFIGPRCKQNKPLPCKPVAGSESVSIPYEFTTAPLPFRQALGNAKSEWTLRNVLGGATLLAKSCQGSLLLAGHPEEFQKQAYIFGRNLALVWKASVELQQFSNDDATFSLVAAPVLFHLQHDPTFYGEFEKHIDVDVRVDYDKIRDVVRSGPGLEKTRAMKREFCSCCLDVLGSFEDSKAKDALGNLVSSL